MNNKSIHNVAVKSSHSLYYRKIPIISPGLIFVQKVFLLVLFSGELIFGAAYYWKEFCVSKRVGLDNKNGVKHCENSLKQLALTVHGIIFGRAYFRKVFCVRDLWGLFSGGLIFFFWGGGGGLIIGISLSMKAVTCINFSQMVVKGTLFNGQKNPRLIM